MTNIKLKIDLCFLIKKYISNSLSSQNFTVNLSKLFDLFILPSNNLCCVTALNDVDRMEDH